MVEHTGATPVDPSTGRPVDPSTAELITRLSEQSSRLVRDELRLAQAELSEKAKRAGVGAGLFGVAGVVALYGVGALVATAILALALALPAWLSALIVAVVLLVVAGVAALMGKKQFKKMGSPAPQQTISSVKRDVQEVKERGHRDDTA
jgi:uncharacterized membrane protein YqjE